MASEEFLKYASSLVDYDSVTGSMKWKERDGSNKDDARWNSRYAGKEAGTVDDRGYRRILIRSYNEKVYRIRVHQLAWYIHHGIKQSGEIDHINQDKLDNRIKNLRDVSKNLNQRNLAMRKNNTSGETGVTWNKARGKWEAFSGLNGRRVYLGLFENIKDAAIVVNDFKDQHGFTDIHGSRAITRAAAAIGDKL